MNEGKGGGKINEFHNMSNETIPSNRNITIEQLYWRSFQEFIQCFFYPLITTLIAILIAVVMAVIIVVE